MEPGDPPLPVLGGEAVPKLGDGDGRPGEADDHADPAVAVGQADRLEALVLGVVKVSRLHHPSSGTACDCHRAG